MKRFLLIVSALLLCLLCFGGMRTAAQEPADGSAIETEDQNSGSVESGPFEYPPGTALTDKPVFYVLVVGAGAIALAAAGVLIYNARRKQKD
jgi:hypothetical protein